MPVCLLRLTGRAGAVQVLGWGQTVRGLALFSYDGHPESWMKDPRSVVLAECLNEEYEWISDIDN